MAVRTDNVNYLQPSNFKITIERQKYGNLQFFAQSVVHPGIAVSSAQVPFSRIQTVSVPGDTLNFDELQIDLIIDEDMNSYTEIFNWIKSLTDSRSNPTENFIEQDIQVSILSSSNNVIKTIKYLNAVPTSIGSITFTASLSDTDVITMPVSFRIDEFEVV